MKGRLEIHFIVLKRFESDQIIKVPKQSIYIKGRWEVNFIVLKLFESGQIM